MSKLDRRYWEFAVTVLDLRWKPSEQKNALDRYGADGWELRALLQNHDFTVTAYFHRPAGKAP